jgi:hypothetical protein
MRNRKNLLLKWCLSGLLILLFSSQVQAVTVTISGTLYSDEGITPITSADQSIHLVIDGVSIGTSLTDGSGNYSITANVTGPYMPLLIYVDNGSVVGTTITVLYSSTSVSINDLHIYANHLITRQDEGGTPLDNGDISNAVGSYNDTDILYSITGSDLTVQGTNTVLYIPAGHSYTPSGNINTHHVKINGTLTAGSNTINVSGDWDFTNGTFNRDTSTVNFTGTGTILNDVSNWWNKAFYKLNIAAAGHTTTIPSNRGIVAKDLATLGTGTLAGGNLVLNKGSTPLINNGATFVNGLIKFSPSGNTPQLDIPAGNYPNLWLSSNGTVTDTSFTLLGDINCTSLFIRGNGSNKRATLDTNGHDITCNNIYMGQTNTSRNGSLILNGSTLTISQDIINFSGLSAPNHNEIDAGTATLKIGRSWSNRDTFIAGTSTAIFNGNNDQAIITGGDPFYNVTIDNTGAANNDSVWMNSDITLNNDLIINTGDLNSTASNYNLTVLGNLDQSSTTGELSANASTITVTGDFSADGTLNSTNYNNATVELIGSGTLIYKNLAVWSGNGFKNLTVGQPGKTTALFTDSYRSFTVKNSLTVGSGVFTGTTSSIYLSGSNPLNLDPNATIRLYNLRFYNNSSVQAIPPLNNGYDTHIDISRNNSSVIQTGDITLNSGKNLRLRGDNFASRALNYNTDGFDLNVGGGIFIGRSGGGDTGLKTLDISNSTVTVGRDFEIRTGTNDLISTNSTITLNGTTTQAVTMNGKAMDNLILDNPTEVSFTDAFTANTVTNNRAGSTMTFAEGQDFTVNNAINLQGASGSLIHLVSSSPGGHWNFILNSGASKTIDQVSVSWSDASGSHNTQIPINPDNTVRDSNTIAWFPLPSFSVTKNTTVISDPINGTGGGENRIPGAIIEYSLTTQNTGGYSPDNNTVIVLDVIDSDHVELDVTSGVTFSDGSTSSGVTLGVVSYSHRSTPTSYTYTPTGVFDPNVAGIKIETNGTFAFGGVPTPEFTVTYRVRVR